MKKPLFNLDTVVISAIGMNPLAERNTTFIIVTSDERISSGDAYDMCTCVALS